jgi:hypothetical protein
LLQVVGERHVAEDRQPLRASDRVSAEAEDFG